MQQMSREGNTECLQPPQEHERTADEDGPDTGMTIDTSVWYIELKKMCDFVCVCVCVCVCRLSMCSFMML